MDFANDLNALGVFGPRYSGPLYEEYKNNLYANTNDRTFLVGGIGSRPTFLYIFKPQSNVVILEIWKWASAPHYGHVVLNGDELVYKKSFSCMRLSL